MFRSDMELKLECLKLAIHSCCSYDAVDLAKQYYRFLVENSENVPAQFLFNNKANLNLFWVYSPPLAA